MNEEIKVPTMQVTPLKKICMTIGELPTSYLETMTYYEMLVWFTNFLRDNIIPTVNNNAEAVKELQNLFTELQNYVNNYFDNLDVQDEINNKLDEMVEDGTFESILYDYIGDKCDYIFPGQWGTNNSSGNSTLVKVSGKNILFDTNAEDNYSYLKSMLAENNVTHLDYVIISHFDSDHKGNLISLINENYIDENTIYIHPSCITTIYSSDVQLWYLQVEELCESLGITSKIPLENEIVNVSNTFSMRFANLDVSYAELNYTNTNECSMITECKHNNFVYLVMGDALIKTEQYLLDNGFIDKEINLYEIPHHAIEENCNLQFYELINPKFAVAQAGLHHYNLNLFTKNRSSALLEEKNCVNYFSFNNTNNIHFIEHNGHIECIKGIPLSHAGQSYRTTNIYCDSVNFNERKQDGSATYPFKDLPQAIGTIKDWKNAHINIILRAGTYGSAYTGTNNTALNTISLVNRKNYITIEGHDKTDTTLNFGLVIRNCFNVQIKNVTIKPEISNNSCAFVESSKVLFIDCNFEGNDITPLERYGIRTAISSIVRTSRCKFNKLEVGYYIRGGSVIHTYADLISNLTTFVNYENNCDINIGHFNGNSDFTSITNFYDDSAGSYIFSNSQPYRLSISNKMLGNITLPIKADNNIYKYLVIHYALKNNGNIIGRGKKVIPFTEVSNLLISDFNAKNDTTIDTYTLVCSISNNTISITRNTCTHIASTGALTSYNPSSESDLSYGIQIAVIELI